MATSSEEFDAGHGPVSMSDMAKRLGVSVTTISRALSDHHSIGPATKKLVQDLARELNYQPNTLASALRKGRSKLLGVIVPFIEGRFFPSVVHGIEIVASQAGYSVIICQSHEDMEIERQNVETLLSAQVAGILVSMSRDTTEFGHFEKVRRRGIPLVFFDRVMDGDAINAVVLNDREGGRMVTRHLLEQGCRRIAHFGSMQHLSIYQERYRGYRDALEEYGVPYDADLVRFIDLTPEAGSEAMADMMALPQPPDAVFSSGDASVLGALQWLKSRKIRVPQDVALAGFSNEAFTAITDPMITSVDQRCEEMGQGAVRLFLELVANGAGVVSLPQLVLEPQLFVRESSSRQHIE